MISIDLIVDIIIENWGYNFEIFFRRSIAVEKKGRVGETIYEIEDMEESLDDEV